MMSSIVVPFFMLTILLIAGASAQEDPWPPLITTCDVMPLIAADANKAGQNLVACSSSARPSCETINCAILSNNDQLELELLPCWQHPAMWIKNRAINGTMLYQDIFDSSRVAVAKIGGSKVQLNVTVVQRDELTLGFGINMLVLGSPSLDIMPYRDIPLNLTECPTGISPELPLMCKMNLYMEQYIITSYSSIIKDPSMTPMCQRPDPGTCNLMRCSWNTSVAMVYHEYQFLPCDKPQAVRLMVVVGLEVFNLTYTKSTVVKLNMTTSLNVTLNHLSDQSIGFGVELLVLDQVITELPYTILPMDTNGCTFRKQKHTFHPYLLTHDRRITRSFAKTSSSSTKSGYSASLISGCDVMPRIIDALNSASGSPVHCISSNFSDCSNLNCTVTDTGDIFKVDFIPCTDPPSLSLIVVNNQSRVLFNRSVNGSISLNVSITNNTVPMKFNILQHSDYLTMGLSVMATLDGNNVTLLPYSEFPMDRMACSGEAVPPPMCGAMWNMAQYLNIFLSNGSETIDEDPVEDPVDCSVSSTCTNINCSLINGSISFEISPCDQVLMISIQPENYSHTFRESGMESVDNDSMLNVLLQYNKTENILELEVVAVFTDDNNGSLSVPIIPYIEMPLNLTGCNGALVTTCELMPQLADKATKTSNRSIHCIPSSSDCNAMTCNFFSSNGSLTVQLLSCANPPAVEVRTTNGSNIQNSTNFTSTNSSLSVNIGNMSALLNVTVVQHPQQLTLGVEIVVNISGTHQVLSVIRYHEIPLSCPQKPTNKTPTCHVMDNVVQYINVYISNMTNQPSNFQATRTSLCNNITCFYPQHTSAFNMSFLPCGNAIGFNIDAGDNATTGYSSTVYNTSVIQLDDETSAHVTLEQRNESTVDFKMDLYNNNTFSGTIIPLVTIPVDLGICSSTPTPPPPTNNSYFKPLITTCDLMPLIAATATKSISDILVCTSSPEPNCDQVLCTIFSNNDTLEFRVLPCNDPPGIQLINRNISGDVRFNQTFTSTVNNVTAPIGSNPAVLNVTIVQHTEMLTLGVMLNATIIDNNGSEVAVQFIPYREIPLNRKACSSAHDKDTPTCKTMDSIAQYLTVYFGNISQDVAECQALRSELCNTFNCTLSLDEDVFSYVFLPCAYPIGVTTYFTNSSLNTTLNGTIYQSTSYNYDSHLTIETTLDQLGSDLIGFQILVDVYYPEYNIYETLVEIPYVQIPLDSSMCNGTNPDFNHSSNSLISTCDTMPQLAHQASAAFSGELDCLSTVVPDCNTAYCISRDTGTQVALVVGPCNDPPTLSVLVNEVNDTDPTITNLTSSQEVRTSSDWSLYFNILQRKSHLSLGLELTYMTTGANITVLDYREIPLDRSKCSLPAVPDTCASLTNISQYINVVISNATGEPTDCSVSGHCQGMMCSIGRENSTISFTLVPCHRPPALIAVARAPNGTVMFNVTLSEPKVLDWRVLSDVLKLNVTILHYNVSTIGLKADLLYPESNSILHMIPMVEIPLNITGCSGNPPTYSNDSFVTTCQIMQTIAESPYPIGIEDLRCNSSPPPNCSSITCMVGDTGDLVEFEFQPCSKPQSVVVSNYHNGTVIYQQELSETSISSFNITLRGKNLPMNVMLVNHTAQTSLGFKVNVNHTREFFPYREIPFNRSTCSGAAVHTQTCNIMSNIAQYMTVFLANLTTNRTKTPDCYTIDSSLCNNITCVFPGGKEMLKYAFLPCEDPIAFNFIHVVGNETVVNSVYKESGMINIMGNLDVQMYLDHLNDHAVRFGINYNTENFNGYLVPFVNISLDTEHCREGPTTGSTATPHATTGGTGKHDAKSSSNVVKIVVPVVVVVVLIIVVICCAVVALLYKNKIKKKMVYAFKPFSGSGETDDGDPLLSDQEGASKDD